jgi:hypothetical protein
LPLENRDNAPIDFDEIEIDGPPSPPMADRRTCTGCTDPRHWHPTPEQEKALLEYFDEDHSWSISSTADVLYLK